MEQTNNSFANKAFAVVGFIVAVLFLLWLAVQMVTLLPGAFSSLASLADGVYNERPQSEIIVANQNSIVNTDEGFTIAWSDLNRDGMYTFSYSCAEGVALDIRHPGSRITSVECGEVVELGNMIYSLEIIAQSERSRFTDVDYTIGFIPTGDTVATISKTSTFTAVNASIPQGGLADAGITEDDTADEEVPMEEEIMEPEVTTPVVTTPSTPAVAPLPPAVIETPVYTIPVSNPNGTVDLAVRYLQVGTLDANNNFIKGGVIDENARGAFQFEVKNVGTKTSGDWSFVATLTSGVEFDSATQAPLKPNERSILTIGFDNVGQLGAQRFGAEVTVPNDVNLSNNLFSWAVNVVE